MRTFRIVAPWSTNAPSSTTEYAILARKPTKAKSPTRELITSACWARLVRSPTLVERRPQGPETPRRSERQHEHVVLRVGVVAHTDEPARIRAQDRVACEEDAAADADVAEALDQGRDEGVVDRDRVLAAHPLEPVTLLSGRDRRGAEGGGDNGDDGYCLAVRRDMDGLLPMGDEVNDRLGIGPSAEARAGAAWVNQARDALWRPSGSPASPVPGPGYAASVPKTRLDTLLTRRGLFPTRSRAAAAVMAGQVRLRGGSRADKPGQLVADDVAVAVDAAPAYVSRGGVKLANALDAFALAPAGRSCLDVGASTGGFTDCLLERGAKHVVAIDVAYGQLDWGLRNDPRVTVLERVNARSLDPSLLPNRPSLIVVDVSFISLSKVLASVLCAAAERFDCLALVKPQFEVGRGRVGKGGVVRSAEQRRAALVAVGSWAQGAGYAVLGYESSRLPGSAGNRESFVWIAEPGRPGDVADLEPAARRAEP